MKIGIMGFGTHFPDKRMTAAEIADRTGIPEEVIREKFGVIEKPVPGPEDTTSALGTEAAKKAINMAGIEAAEIDVVIWNGGQHKDYPCWLAGLKVADTIGATRAWSFDMEAMCGSMMAGMEVAKSLMITNQEYRTVLLVSGYRNGDLISYDVPETSFMYDIGAGGAAVILRKDYDKNLLLATAFKGDGSFTEDCVVKVGGTAKWPMQPEDVDRYHFAIDNIDEFKRKLGERTLPNFYAVIREALIKSDLSQEDIDYLAILHFKRSTHLMILEELGLTEEQTTYLNMFGHIGQNDQIISLEQGLAQGKINAGDTIVMVGAGLGFVWAAGVVRWG